MAKKIKTGIDVRIFGEAEDLKRALYESLGATKAFQGAMQGIFMGLGIGLFDSLMKVAMMPVEMLKTGFREVTEELKEAWKGAVDFQYALAEVKTLGVKDIEELKRGVEEVAMVVGEDLVGETKAFYQAISAGVPEENVFEFVQTASKAAVAGITETRVAVDAITNVINAYKLQWSDAMRVSDLMFTSVKLGKTTFEELAHSIGRVTAIAYQAGVPLEDLFATIVEGTKAGLATDEAITGLRAALTDLIKPSQQAAEAFVELKIVSGENVDKYRKLKEEIEGVEDAVRGLDAEISELTIDQREWRLWSEEIRSALMRQEELQKRIAEGKATRRQREEYEELREKIKEYAKELEAEAKAREVYDAELLEGLGVRERVKTLLEEINRTYKEQKFTIEELRLERDKEVAAIAEAKAGIEEYSDTLRQAVGKALVDKIKEGGLVKTLQEIRDATEGDVSALGRLFEDVRSLNFAAAVSSAKSLTTTLNEMELSAGATAGAFEEIDKTFKQQWKKFKATLKVARTEIAGPFVEMGAEVVSAINEWFSMPGKGGKTPIEAVREFAENLRIELFSWLDLVKQGEVTWGEMVAAWIDMGWETAQKAIKDFTQTQMYAEIKEQIGDLWENVKPEIIKVGKEMGVAILKGIIKGLWEGQGKLAEALVNFIKREIKSITSDWLFDALKMSWGGLEDIGEWIGEQLPFGKGMKPSGFRMPTGYSLPAGFGVPAGRMLGAGGVGGISGVKVEVNINNYGGGYDAEEMADKTVEALARKLQDLERSGRWGARVYY